MQNKLGKHFITGLESTVLLDEEKRLLEKIQPSGLIFFSRNFASPVNNPAWRETFRKLIDDALEYSQGSIRILSIDYEGGRVHRFPNEVKQFPYAQEWKNQVISIAKEMAEILQSFSLNMTYCPVLDVDLESSNPVIGPRSFSPDSEIVKNAAFDFFRTMEKEKIITCGKHFPGHGRTASDSHFTLPFLNTSREDLEIDLHPFKALINEGLPCMMSAHVIYESLDSQYPASLSKKILKNLLRDELKFKGVLFTDDLDMKALSNYGRGEKIRLAFEASTDMMLVGNGMDGKSLLTVDSIINEITPLTNDLEEILELSSERIETLFKKYT